MWNISTYSQSLAQPFGVRSHSEEGVAVEPRHRNRKIVVVPGEEACAWANLKIARQARNSMGLPSSFAE